MHLPTAPKPSISHQQKMWIPSTRLLTPTSLRNIPNPRMHTNPLRISCVALQTVAVGEQDVSFTCLIYGFAHKCAEWNHMGNPIVHGEQRMDPSQMVYWVMGAMLFGIDAQANPCFIRRGQRCWCGVHILANVINVGRQIQDCVGRQRREWPIWGALLSVWTAQYGLSHIRVHTNGKGQLPWLPTSDIFMELCTVFAGHKSHQWLRVLWVRNCVDITCVSAARWGYWVPMDSLWARITWTVVVMGCGDPKERTQKESAPAKV